MTRKGIYDYTECDDIAENMVASGAPRFATMDDARSYVRDRMFSDDSPQIIDNIAEALFCMER